MATPRAPKPRRRQAPVKITEPHPLAWEVARDLATGKAVTLRAEPDGSVRIVNLPT